MKTLFALTTMLFIAACQPSGHSEKLSPCVSLGDTDGPCERFPINVAQTNSSVGEKS